MGGIFVPPITAANQPRLGHPSHGRHGRWGQHGNTHSPIPTQSDTSHPIGSPRGRRLKEVLVEEMERNFPLLCSQSFSVSEWGESFIQPLRLVIIINRPQIP